MQTIQKLVSSPKRLFLIDGLGAILSAFMLGVVLVKWEIFFGIPANVLYYLAAVPCAFAVYDFYVYFRISRNYSPYLTGIATLNLSYCCLSIALAMYHANVITIIGWIYLSAEIAIIIFLAALEYRAARKKE